VIDDMAGTCVAPLVYDAREDGWEALAKRIVEKHVDR
jgi:hypothetical protein